MKLESWIRWLRRGTEAPDEFDQEPRLSATLIKDLATQRRQILVSYVASDPTIALDLTIFLMAQNIVIPSGYIREVA